MPAAIPLAVAGVGAIGSIANAKIKSNAEKRAAQATQQASTDALGYQKGRDAIADQRYMDMWNDYKARHAAWEQRNFGGGGGSGGGGGGGSSYSPPIATPSAMGAAGAASFGAPAEGASMADLGPWSDWRRYGVS